MESKLPSAAADDTRYIFVFLDQHIEEFTAQRKRLLIRRLAKAGRCTQKSIQILSVQSGCVMIVAKTPKEAAMQLAAYMHTWKYGESEDREELPEDFLDLVTDKDLGVRSLRIMEYGDYIIEHRVSYTKVRDMKLALFLHGWTGSDESFGIFPKLLRERYECETHTYRYPTALKGHSPSLTYVVRELHETMAIDHEDKEVVMIAHSQGGILARKLVEFASRQEERLDLRVRGIAFYGAPYVGSVKAKILKHIPGLKSPQVLDLGSDSTILLEMNERWESWAKDFVPQRCKLVSYHGTKDNIVEANNAARNTVGAGKFISIPGKDHSDIVKPENTEDFVVKSTVHFLSSLEFTAE